MQLILAGISKKVGVQDWLYEMSLTPLTGAVTVLLGATQAGKTSLMRIMAGLDVPSRGQVQVNGVDVVGVPVRERNVAMVYQQFINYPSMKVHDNIASPLKLRGEKNIDQRVRELAGKLHIEMFLDRYPAELSGGQQQRVALARALAPRPKLILMDEPFSNLDVELRERLSIEVRDILKREATTALIVTHDQNEAFALADWVGVMHEGRIQQWDTPYNLYHEPINRFVADFVGQGALVTGQVINDHQVEIELGVLSGHLPVECDAGGCDECVRNCRVDVLLRPDDIIHDDDSLLLAEVENKAFRGAEFLYTLKLPSGQRALSLVPSHHNHAIGEKIGIKLAVDHVVAFRRE